MGGDTDESIIGKYLFIDINATFPSVIRITYKVYYTPLSLLSLSLLSVLIYMNFYSRNFLLDFKDKLVLDVGVTHLIWFDLFVQYNLEMLKGVR